MPILDTLAQDHRVLEKLLARLGTIASTEAELRLAAFSKLQSLLQAHARAEEEVVYRPLRECAPDEVLTLEAYEEHHVADVLLQELASSCPGGAGWVAKSKVLEELLRHHIKEEEMSLFALVDQHFDEATQKQMDADFRMLKHVKLETFLGPFRRATPAFAGRATITAQADAGRYMRRGELYLRRALSRLRA